MKPYMPGSHLIATLESSQTALLNRHASFRETLSGLITTLNLQQLGEIYHDFDPQGFTGVVCLSESHISIHTWPEYHKINLDIYLSNYLRSNDNTVDKLFDEIVAFFNARVETVQKIIR